MNFYVSLIFSIQSDPDFNNLGREISHLLWTANIYENSILLCFAEDQ